MNSMTGFGKAEACEKGISITVEIKSVNNRYLDINCKLPRALNLFEDVIRKTVGQDVSRGRVDVFASYLDNRDIKKNVAVDENLAKGYISAAKMLNEKYGVSNDLTAYSLIKIPDVVKADTTEDDEELIGAVLLKAVSKAVEGLNAMRGIEGEALKKDISGRVAVMKELTGKIKERAPFVAEDYKAKLSARIKEALEDVSFDEARLLNEVAFFADRSNIDEELARLFSHYGQLENILKMKEPAGRKLDFLVQELNREVNTICSKSSDIEITNIGLLLKSEIEKIREQVQNIE